jgi:protein-tyrosine kinase
MSRVFDALNRVTEEKKQQSSKAPGNSSERSLAVEKGSGSKPNSAAPFMGGWDGTSHIEGSLRLKDHDLRSMSWREKVEHVLFGWNIRRYPSHPLVAFEEDSAVAEQYKILREQIKKLRTDTGARCLSVTSPLQRDGKTTVAVNLAAAMALDYEGKILLIDSDLRCPELHRYFGIDSSPGLGDYLSSSRNGNLMRYVRDTSIAGFKIIPGGKPTNDSSELLAKEKMKNLMDEIRVRFPEHQIILDAPPVLSTSDPLVLGRHVDGILMVIRAGKTPRDYLAKAVRSLDTAKILGVVLNGVDLKSSYYHITDH